MNFCNVIHTFCTSAYGPLVYLVHVSTTHKVFEFNNVKEIHFQCVDPLFFFSLFFQYV